MRLLAVVGPTASGKSAVAVKIARRLRGEVISADSMQSYRGLDIGTATPSEAEQAGIRHHLLNEWDLNHALTVVEFRDRARDVIEEIDARGVVPILVGGSGLYVRAVTEKFHFPGTDPQVRARWEAELRAHGPAALHAVLSDRDPAAAAHIEASNGRRIVRALEVIEITDEEFQAQLPEPEDHYPTLRVGLRIDRPSLDQRIADRVDAMWEAGFVEEVRELVRQGLGRSPTASRALGYAPIMEYLAGGCTEQEAKERTISQTRTFARRQQRWFTRDQRIHWFDYDDPAIVDSIVSLWTRT